MNIYESAEDYLEQILVLLEEKGYARSTDIAESLGVTKPSVSVAMKKPGRTPARSSMIFPRNPLPLSVTACRKPDFTGVRYETAGKDPRLSPGK